MEKHLLKEAEKRAKLQRWAEEVKEFQDSGMSIQSFCKMKGFHHSTFYRRLRAVQGAFFDTVKVEQKHLLTPVAKPIFVKACLASEKNKMATVKDPFGDDSQNIYIHLNGASIEIRDNASFELIGKVLSAVKCL